MHGQEQPHVVGAYMLEDPEMWIGLSQPIVDEDCDCENTCRCSP